MTCRCHVNSIIIKGDLMQDEIKDFNDKMGSFGTKYGRRIWNEGIQRILNCIIIFRRYEI